MNLFVIATLVLTITTTHTHALKCYTCTSTSDEIDETCINDPASVTTSTPITDCNKKYCISIRQEYVDPKGKVASMARNCVDEPLYKNHVLEDSTFRTYYRACQEDLCNSGPGTDLSTPQISNENGALTTIFVRGTGSASSLIGSITLLLIAQIYLRLH